MSGMSRREILEAIGVLSIVASLIFVGVQIQQSQRLGQGAEAVGYIEQMLTLRELQLEHAGTWRKACVGDELTPEEASVAAILYKTYAEITFTTAIAAEIGITQGDVRFLVNRFAANIHRYPGFRRLSQQQNEWAMDGEELREDNPQVAAFAEAIQRRLAELQEIEPNPDHDIMWCGI